MVRYRKLLVQASWWWTIICSKHVEGNLIEINYKESVHLVGLSHIYKINCWGCCLYAFSYANAGQLKVPPVWQNHSLVLLKVIHHYVCPHKQGFCLTYPFVGTCQRPNLFSASSHYMSQLQGQYRGPLEHPFLLTLLILVLVSWISCSLILLAQTALYSPPPSWLLLPSLHPAFITKPHLQYQIGHNTATLKTAAPFSSTISTATYKTTVSQYTRSYLTFRGPCIVIYFYNKSQQDALFLNFILVNNSTCFGQTYCPSSGVLIL